MRPLQQASVFGLVGIMELRGFVYEEGLPTLQRVTANLFSPTKTRTHISVILYYSEIYSWKR